MDPPSFLHVLMGTSTRLGGRRVPRSSTDPSHSQSVNSNTRHQARQPPQPPEKSSSAYGGPLLPTSVPKTSPSPPCLVMLRRYWKKLNDKDAFGQRSRIGTMIAAFKMGLYFKVFIAVILFLRFASHSSQRSYPTGSVTRENHFYALASAPVSPSLRIAVVTESGYADNVKTLLRSLAKADYDRDIVALDVWMFASSTCDYLPLPIYPLGMAIFGPPRFDHSIPPVVHDIEWPHGEKTLVALRSEPDWAGLWESSRGTANETLLFIDATTATMLSPGFYLWLKRARLATQRGMTANAGVFSLDPVNIPDGVPSSDRAVLLEQFFPASSAFSPSKDVWTTFLKWHAKQTRIWFARPSLRKDGSVGGYDIIDSLRVDPVRAWFAQFMNLYRERVVHPVLPENSTLVLRAGRTTGAKAAGTGRDGPVHIHRLSEVETNLFEGSLKDVSVPERPVLVKENGTVATPDAAFGILEQKIPGKTRGANIDDLVDQSAAKVYRDVLRRIAEFARSRGSQSVSFTLATGSFVDTTLSWLCNVVSLDIVPPAMVIVTSDDKVASQLTKFIAKHPRLEQGSLIISMQGTIKAVVYAASPDAALHFGTSEYWMLMLQRTFLLRDLLQYGISVLHFETDQIWLSDPMPYIQHDLQNPSSDDNLPPDMVITLNTRKEVAGNFFYLRPTIGTRNLLSAVVDRFFVSYQVSLKSRGSKDQSFHYIANDQSLLTTLVLQHDWVFKHTFPPVTYTVLDEQLFVDGTWFLDFEDETGKKVTTRTHYTSESSLYPVVLNNNFLIGIEEKMKRAQRFGFWFLRRTPHDLSPVCDDEAAKKAGRSGSSKEQREDPVIEIGRA